MKKKLLIATHSVFADGIKNAMELVTGEQNSVSTLCAYTNDMTEVETPIKEIIDALCDDEELIVTTDIFGGSVNNEFMKYLSKSNIHLIAGVDFDPVKVDISLKSADGVIEIVKDGIATDYSEDEATKVLSADAVTADINVHNGDFEATAWGCDLTHDYVTINADYRS